MVWGIVLCCCQGSWCVLLLILLGTGSSLMLAVGQKSVSLTVQIQNQIQISDILYASCALFAMYTLCEAGWCKEHKCFLIVLSTSVWDVNTAAETIFYSLSLTGQGGETATHKPSWCCQIFYHALSTETKCRNKLDLSENHFKLLVWIWLNEGWIFQKSSFFSEVCPIS